MESIHLLSAEQTQIFGEVIGKTAQASDNLFLTGDLGAGKTTMTKGVGKGLGIRQMIKSPTYTIVREYEQGRLPFYHMDIYRLAEGADDLGFDDYFEGSGLTVVEWGELLGEEKPNDYLEIIIKKQEDENKRVLEFQTYGQRSVNWLKEIKEEWIKQNGNRKN